MSIDLTVKTLDSNVYQFSVSNEFTVKEFKQYIAQTVSVAWDKQRIIFGGKVLQDDRRLEDCNVAGKTVHLVQRVPPPASRGPVAMPVDEAGARSGHSSQQPPQGEPTRVPLERAGNNVYVGAFTLPRVEVGGAGGAAGGAEQLDQMIQQVISSMVDINRHATVVSQGTSADGNSINYHINIGESEGSQEGFKRLLTVRALLRVAFNGVNALEGRPSEDFSALNQPAGARAEFSRLFSAPGPAASTSGSTSGGQASAPPEEQQVKDEEDTGVDVEPSADEPMEDAASTGESSESSQGARPQLKRDPRRPISFLANRDFNDQPLRQVLANVYDELDYLNERLAPFLNQYRDLLRRETLTPDDVNAEETRRVTHRVAEVTHTISHVQHLLSDLDIDPREPSRIVVRPSAPLLPNGTQLSSHHIDHGVPIRAQINVNTVAILSNGNGNLSTGETQAGAGASPAAPVEPVLFTREAPAGQGSGGTVGEAAAQASAAGGSEESPAGGHQAGGQSGGQSGAANGNSERPSRSFNPAVFVRRVSNAAFRSVSRSCSNAGAGSSAAGAGAGQTPSREETTASNTTTATTQTPTTAGAAMGGARSGGRGPSGGGGPGSGGTAFTMPTATPSHQGLRPSTVVREIFDPFLVCESFFNTAGRRQMGGRLRFTIPVRSSSVPAGMRRQPREADAQPPRTPPNTAALLEAFVQSMFPGLGVFNSMPMASFINWEVGDEGSQNELINDLLATVASTITTTDFMEVLGQHNYRSLNGLRVPLREFLNRRLLYGEPYSAQLLETRLGASVDSMARDIAHETRGADVYPDIDLVATLSGFLKSRVFDIFKFIFEAGDESNFGDRLAELNIELIKDSLSLLAMCCRDGSASVERILMARTRELERQDLEMPLLTALMTQSGARRENVRVNEALRRYIVVKPAGESSREPSAAGVGEAPNSDDRMEVEATAQTMAAPLSGQARVSNNGVTTEYSQAHLESPVSHETALSALRSAVPDTPPSAGSEWMGGVPPGWAPIIARDMGSQAGVQRPLSDAYLSGMPSKRRRLMKQTSPSQLSDIPASIQQAIQRAGVRPRTSVDALNADVQRNTLVLQDALQSSIRDALARRLTEETADFDKDKFPNAHRIAKPK